MCLVMYIATYLPYSIEHCEAELEEGGSGDAFPGTILYYFDFCALFCAHKEYGQVGVGNIDVRGFLISDCKQG